MVLGENILEGSYKELLAAWRATAEYEALPPIARSAWASPSNPYKIAILAAYRREHPASAFSLAVNANFVSVSVGRRTGKLSRAEAAYLLTVRESKGISKVPKMATGAGVVQVLKSARDVHTLGKRPRHWEEVLDAARAKRRVAEQPPMLRIEHQESPQVHPQEARTRCWTCSRKVGLAAVACKCGYIFCSTHRYAEQHACTFNYRVLARRQIECENPRIWPKLDRE